MKQEQKFKDRKKPGSLVRRNVDVIVACLLALLFILFPEIDLLVASWFYQPGTGFDTKLIGFENFLYFAPTKLWLLAILLPVLIALSFLSRFRQPLLPRRLALAYLLAALVIGPGLMVESAKSLWDRARPRHLVEFGGQASFAPALVPSDQCERNCSFVSGHAAAGFFLMVGFWVTRRRLWLVSGMLLGLYVGYIRIKVGGHFLSDVVFAGIIVYFTCRGLAYLFKLPATPRKEEL